jgi:hypothetical protein
MRLWTLHPKYLDPQGLVALWREGLLAQRVLEGRTRGYRHHPQLQRFRDSPDPLAAIASYLRAVLAEATLRGYAFNASLIATDRQHAAMPATDGQLRFEALHLRSKLAIRNPDFVPHARTRLLDPHPLFRIVRGPLEAWERAPVGARTRS